MKKLITVLSKNAAKVRALEEDAKTALYDRADKGTYKKILRQKSLLLFHLPEEVDRTDFDFGKEMRKDIKDRLGGISFSAGRALNLDSVFYMSALLYPENYQDGDRNDLERVIDYLETAL